MGELMRFSFTMMLISLFFDIVIVLNVLICVLDYYSMGAVGSM